MTAANPFDAQYVYLTTTGRKSGLLRRIEIWFVEHEGHIYILAEHGHQAQWVKNLMSNSAVEIKINDRQWNATGRVLDAVQDAALYTKMRELSRTKYGWGDGLPVEFRLDQTILD